MFLAHGDAEGVYEACGYHFESEELERQWSARIDATRLTTMRYAVDPRSLFYSQAPIGRFGYANTNGWTVRLSVFHKTGFFNESLELHQDTDLYVKFASVCRMYPGNLTSAVSMRRVHAHNRISAVQQRDAAFRHKVKMWWSICSWLTQHGTKKQAFVALQRFSDYIISYRWNSSTATSRFSAKKIRTVYEICPAIFMQKRFYLAAATSVAVALFQFLKRSVIPAVPL